MSYDTPHLTDQEVLRQAQARLEEALPLHAAGTKCTTDDLFKVLVGVAANQGTIESLCADLVGTPNPQTIRRYLNEQLCVEDLPELEKSLNTALAVQFPGGGRRRAHEVAIDYHDRPYYGKGAQETELWVRGKAKNGTTRFYRIATAYLVLNGLRVTLALHFVQPEEETVDVLATLLKRVQAQGLRVSCLLMDKGFDSIAVMNYLTHHGYSALIACTIRGSTGGTRALCHGRKSYQTWHTFKGGLGQEFTATVLICRVFTTARRTGRMSRRADWLVFIAIHLDLSPRYARQLYRSRFGVETSYRCSGHVRGWTTAKKPVYRFVLLALAFLLLNVWVQLRWLFTQVPRQGGRWLDSHRFRLTRFVHFLRRTLERFYGYVQTITAPAVPRA